MDDSLDTLLDWNKVERRYLSELVEVKNEMDAYIVEIANFTEKQQILRPKTQLPIKFDALDIFVALKEQGINVKHVKKEVSDRTEN